MSSYSASVPVPRARNREPHTRHVETTRVTKRWKISTSELCTLTGVNRDELNRWAKLGVFKGRRLRGDYINLDTAVRAVLMRHLLRLGVREQIAALLVASLDVTDSPVSLRVNGRPVTVDLTDLSVR